MSMAPPSSSSIVPKLMSVGATKEPLSKTRMSPPAAFVTGANTSKKGSGVQDIGWKFGEIGKGRGISKGYAPKFDHDAPLEIARYSYQPKRHFTLRQLRDTSLH
jgi:hypothetical protein